MKLVSLSKESFDSFARNHKYRNYCQTAAYGEIMKNNNFEVSYIGFMGNNNELLGATLLLTKNLLGDFKYAYAPRGFLIDYTDSDLVNEVTKKLQRKLLKEKYVLLKIDPIIHCSERDRVGKIISYNHEIDNIISILESNGYKHRGFNKYFENTKPRWNAVLKFTSNTDRLYSNLDDEVRKKIESSIAMGTEIFEGKSDDIPLFYSLIKNKSKKTIEYYEAFYKYFKDEFKIYFAKVNGAKFVIEVQNKLDEENTKNDWLDEQIKLGSSQGLDVNNIITEKLESDRLINIYKKDLIHATKILKEHPQGLIIGAIAVLEFNKVIYTIIEGFNKKYTSLSPLELLRWSVVDLFGKNGSYSFNMNAIVGDFKENKYTNLNNSKLAFNAHAIEFVGEFDFIINKPMYTLYNLLPLKNSTKKRAE